MEKRDAGSQVGEDVALQFLHFLGRGPNAELVRLLDQGANDKHLSPGRDLLANEVVSTLPLVRRHQSGGNGQPAWRHFVQHRDVQITEEGQPQGPRDRGRGHREKMRPEFALADR